MTPFIAHGVIKSTDDFPKNKRQAFSQGQWLITVMLATGEAETGRIKFQWQPGQKISKAQIGGLLFRWAWG
jgi:hypothetical protein